MICKEGFSTIRNLVSKKRFRKKFPLCAAAIACVILLSGIHGIAQDEHALHEEYQAQAMGQGTQLGQTLNVTVHIDEYSTPEERQILIDAFNTGGSKGLYNALDKMSSRGHIAITGTLGYDIKYARKIPSGDGFRLIVVTNRPIDFREAWINGRSMEYNLSYLEMTLNKETGKGTGTLIPAAAFKIDKKTGEVTIEAFKNSFTLANVQDRSRR